MDAVIISVGTELVTGQCVDTNSAWLSGELSPFGVQVVRHVTVGDDVERLEGAIREAMGKAGIIVITGGLGPTADDITRDALAAAIDAPLEENAEALGQIRAMFERWQRHMSDANRVQALIPRGCEIIPNKRGTAPGIRHRGDRTEMFALPGVPAEMKAMFTAAIEPVVRAAAGEAAMVVGRLLCYGIAEAKVGELLADLMDRTRNPLVGTTASNAVISVRVVARGGNPDEARQLVESDLAEIRARLGSAVFGEGEATLQEAVARLLIQQGKTVAVAESCTGGLLAKRLTDVPGSSAYFRCGYVTYSNEAKSALLQVSPELIATHGAVSEATARAMALGCRSAAGTDFATSITGIAGPSGGSPPDKPVGLVYIGLADSNGVEVKGAILGEHLSRAEIRDRSSKAALNLLRLRLLRLLGSEMR
jgi:nicotinamide-nucleotide amidase